MNKFIGFLIILSTIIIFFISLSTGSDGLNFADLSDFFSENQNGKILRQIRLPHSLGALLCGALLGISGAIMQSILKNPLASPYTLGISQAGAFGASFYIIFLSNLNLMFLSIEISAFISSLICIFAIVILAKNLSVSSIVLFGIGLGAFFGAMTMFIQYFANENDTAATLFWTFGDISKATFSNDLILGIALIFGVIIVTLNYWKFDALGFGDEKALSLGVNVKAFRFFFMLFATLLSTLCVCYFGIIGFVGLVAPHIIKFIFGYSHKNLFILTAFCGAFLLGVADIFSRLIINPVIVPVGILMAFIGVPMLLFLLAKKGSDYA